MRIKNIKIIILCACFFSCNKAQTASLKDYIIRDEFLSEDEIGVSGFLKDDVTLHTPYGIMEIGPIGFNTGYQFDIWIYKNNMPRKIWLKEKSRIEINGLNIVVPSFTENCYSCIDFYENYSIQTCRIAEPVEYKNFLIPENSVLHFDASGSIESFVVYRDVDFNGNIIRDGTTVRVVDEQFKFEF